MSYTSTDITPVTEPITVEMAQEQLYLPDSPNTDLLEAYITAARQWVERYTGRHMVPKDVIYINALMSRTITVPHTIDSVTSITVDGKTVTHTKCESNVIQLTPYSPASGTVVVKYKSVADTNKVYVTAALLIVGHLYENRQIVDTKLTNVKMLLEPFRILNPSA